MKKYYVMLASGERWGPASLEDLGAWLKAGAINPATLIQNEAGASVPAGALLFANSNPAAMSPSRSAAQPAPPRPPMPPAQAPRPSPPPQPAQAFPPAQSGPPMPPARPAQSGSPMPPARPAQPGPAMQSPPPIPPASGYIAPLAGSYPSAGGSEGYSYTQPVSANSHLRDLATWQRKVIANFARALLMRIVGVTIMEILDPTHNPGSVALAGGVDFLSSAASLVFVVLCLIAIYHLARLLKHSAPFLYVIGAMLPCIGLLLIYLLVTGASTELRAAGITVGFLGADPKSIPD